LFKIENKINGKGILNIDKKRQLLFKIRKKKKTFVEEKDTA